MKTIRPTTRSSQDRKRASDPPAPPPAHRRANPPPAPSEVKLLLVDFRSGEAVRNHPDLKPWLEADWQVRSAVPRVVERGITKLLVVLESPVPDAKRPSTRPPRMRSVQL